MGQELMKVYQEMTVYRAAFDEAMALYWLVPDMLLEEEDSLGQEIVMAARAVCAHLAKAWGQRRCYKAFVDRLVEAEMMAVTVETWLAFAMECGYLKMETGQVHCSRYRSIFSAIRGLMDEAAQVSASRR